ncbi:MAG: protoheme IX farnesyltransferase, partial [Gemmatimonadetes bacterium]|nr:protoheme IX farnesyltransferase [Gemmatimonadota bacterium]NIQ59717.1 protoheme IX farnesyltransferase [Gemmatimonadota bacterium]NIU79919.1 protoheme IX farnesyltransferase [Gammaproteobacteria bacterium]NIX48396.1 protoheme IX farnesyltransferase [Gemmatimonadota bacterium]NIY12837.1 protoheme IX farnesyltransferase [Gemmatimonadota bacterium]
VRPLPSGRLRPGEALRFSWGTALVGLIYLGWSINVLTALVVASSLASYVFVYT